VAHGHHDGVHHLVPDDARRWPVAVAIGDDFALFGDFDLAVQRGRRLRQDGPVGRPATAPDAATAPVEELQRHSLLGADVGQRSCAWYRLQLEAM
jgi:hypothetical protein